MIPSSNDRLVRGARVAGSVSACLVVVVASAVLVGWQIGSASLTTVVPGLVAMNPLTAVCFILSGAALLTWSSGAAGGRRWMVLACAAAVGFSGLVRLVGTSSAWDFPLDRLMFESRLDSGSGLPNRMAPNTALNFCLLGPAIAALALRRGAVAQLLALGAALTAFIALTGYAYSITSLVGVAAFIPMAIHTAVLFLVVTAALLCVTPEVGPMRAMTSGSAGGRVIRRMLPALVVGPPVLGWLRLQGELAGWYATSSGVAFTAGAMVALGIGLTWITARAVDVGEAERRRAEEITFRLAHHDNLTGLPNRRLFEDRLRRALSRARRARSRVALMFLDLDGFKKLNDTLGHDAGDQALQEVARRIQTALRLEDTAARLGGDEFAIVLEQFESVDDVEAVGRRLLSLVDGRYPPDGAQAELSASIGVALSPTDGSLPGDLLKLADEAMYRAKRAGKNQIAFHGL